MQASDNYLRLIINYLTQLSKIKQSIKSIKYDNYLRLRLIILVINYLVLIICVQISVNICIRYVTDCNSSLTFDDQVWYDISRRAGGYQEERTSTSG